MVYAGTGAVLPLLNIPVRRTLWRVTPVRQRGRTREKRGQHAKCLSVGKARHTGPAVPVPFVRQTGAVDR